MTWCVRSPHSEVRGLALLAALLALSACGRGAPERPAVVLGATHTLQDSGMLDSLVAGFRRAHPEYALRVIVSGTGEVLEQARRGDVDVVLSHAPAAEQRALAENVVAMRRELMYNHFIIVGPPADPAGVRAQSSAQDAIVAITNAGAPFVTRDDSSGTHLRELELFAGAGVAPSAAENLVRVGGGMADALRVADQRDAYVLTDPATFEVLRPTLRLVPLLRDDAALRNTYAVMLAPRGPDPEAAMLLHDWLLGSAARSIIERAGEALFRPATENETPDAR